MKHKARGVDRRIMKVFTNILRKVGDCPMRYMILLTLLLPLAGCGPADSWTVVVWAVDCYGDPIPDVWVDVRSSVESVRCLAFTDEDGIAYVRVQEGDFLVLEHNGYRHTESDLPSRVGALVRVELSVRHPVEEKH